MVWRFATWQRDDIQVVEKYPENLFGNIYDFLVPNCVGAFFTHLEDKANWPL